MPSSSLETVQRYYTISETQVNGIAQVKKRTINTLDRSRK